MLEKRSQMIQKLTSQLYEEEQTYLKIKKELDNRDPWDKERIIGEMLNQLSTYQTTLATKTLLYHELKSVIGRYASPGRQYGHTSRIKRIYFNIGPQISLQIRNLNREYSFHKNNFTVVIDFDHQTNSITTRIGNKDVFNKQKGKNLEKEEIGILKKSIMSKIKNEYNHYSEIVPNMIELVEFIQNDFKQILLGIHLSQIGE